MLQCLIFQLQLRSKRTAAQQPHANLKQHLTQCHRCRQTLEAEIVTSRILESLKGVEPQSTPTDFYIGIQRRIRTIQAQQSFNTPIPMGWESVILQFQRVILSGAAVAALCIGLLAYAQSNQNNQSNNRESGLESYISPTQGDRMIITRSDPISQDDVLFALVTEDPENARQ